GGADRLRVEEVSGVSQAAPRVDAFRGRNLFEAARRPSRGFAASPLPRLGRAMELPERDSTREWTLPEDARPPLVSELVARIDGARATAGASGAAVMTVGAAAIDAAEQAKRAADLAERASAAMLGRAAPVPPQPRPEATEEQPLPAPRRPDVEE